MRAQQINLYLQEKRYPYFDILYEDSDGIIKKSYSMLDSNKDQTEALIKTKEVYLPGKMWVLPRMKNGNNFSKFAIKQPLELSSIAGSNGVQMKGLNGASSDNSEQSVAIARTTAPDSYFQSSNGGNVLSSAMIEVWKFKYNDEHSRRRELEDENKRLKEDVEKLKKENFELEKENKFKDKDFELVKKLEDSERKAGLNGLVEATKETLANPEALANLAGVLQQINAMRNPQPAGLPMGNTGISGLPDGLDPEWFSDVRMMEITKLFSNQSETNKNLLYRVIAKAATQRKAAQIFVES